MRANSATFSAVNIHVANVAFQGNVAKTMAGGWSAGGATPPKLALLNIASDGIAGGAQNAEGVIQSYLTRAGLDTASAGGTATGTHGQIYDKLDMADFLPDASGNPATSRLFQNGYQILWVPHWAAPGLLQQRRQLQQDPLRHGHGQPGAHRHRGLLGRREGRLRGVRRDRILRGRDRGRLGLRAPRPASARASATPTSSPAPTTGFSINAWNGTNVTDTTVLHGNYSSPLMQIGDYPFYAEYGALDDYRPVRTTCPARSPSPRLAATPPTTSSP